MINKFLIKTIFLFSLSLFSQEETQEISFTTIGSVKEYYYSKKDSFLFNTIRADVKIKDGKFSILLIDFNKNDSFNDYRGCCKEAGGSDGIILLDYKEDKLSFYSNHSRFITKNYPIALNGKTFILNNIHKNIKGLYVANIVKKNIEPKLIFKTKNKVLIDNLHSVLLNYYYNNEEFDLKNKLKKKQKLILRVMNQSNFATFLKYGSDTEVLLNKYFRKELIVYVVIIKDRERYNYMFNKFNPKKKEFLTIDKSRKKEILKLGYNFYEPCTIVFDEKGKVITTDIVNYAKLIELKKKNK